MTLTENIVRNYSEETKKFLANYHHIHRETSNGHFFIICNASGYLDNDILDRVLVEFHRKPRPELQLLINSSCNVLAAWVSLIDLLAPNDLPLDKMNSVINGLVDDMLLSVGDMVRSTLPLYSMYYILRRFYCLQLLSSTPSTSSQNKYKYKVIKQILIEHVDTTCLDRLKTARQEFKQFKMNSSARECVISVASKSSSTSSLPNPTLPSIVHEHIIDHLVLDNSDLPFKSTFLVSLATVSKHFLKSVRRSVSNNVLQTLAMRSMINYIGSNYCLWATPPLHLDYNSIKHIPDEHMPTCLSRLQSLIIAFGKMFREDDDSFFRSGTFPVLETPQLRHLKLVEIDRIIYQYRYHSGQVTFKELESHNMAMYYQWLYQHYITPNPMFQTIECSSLSLENPQQYMCVARTSDGHGDSKVDISCELNIHIMQLVNEIDDVRIDYRI
ncbi:hypothetical protein SAMD00019534_002560 [Acytostelium subglobosum LB1]|uniref:hypothetical protein n=1 Tax=Acytostelium subglobosum LB1 TaxID=1410327 RepID=UPI00064496ED|nr:hypothetical protein SAMD00019534_002560 [Acytostelium subglobosum LB1]GAM17081.1 hypothetical protein SAMD00019534_002560 [Acytostelium subglobosum LB1]|eukprot:XP_012759143.1 hypothetical protein SAMD00019534_002560 [Acytostelium subglobosum LB1]